MVVDFQSPNAAAKLIAIAEKQSDDLRSLDYRVNNISLPEDRYVRRTS